MMAGMQARATMLPLAQRAMAILNLMAIVCEIDRVPWIGVASAVAVPSGQNRELFSLRQAG